MQAKEAGRSAVTGGPPHLGRGGGDVLRGRGGVLKVQLIGLAKIPGRRLFVPPRRKRVVKPKARRKKRPSDKRV